MLKTAVSATLAKSSFSDGEEPERWQSPELMASESEDGETLGTPTTMSDVYAFSCVCLEVCPQLNRRS